MAFLWKHPQSKFFIARFRDLKGVARNRSTKSTNRKEAQRLADAFEEAATKRRTARQARKVIADLHKEITGGELTAPSFAEFSASWIERKGPEIAPATLSFYKKVKDKFAEHLGQRAAAEIAEVTSEDIVAFRNAQAKALSAKTVNQYLKGLRMIFRAAERDTIIAENPCEFVNLTKSTSTAKRRPFTIPELRAVLAVADDEWKSLIRFGLFIGQRLGDLAWLTWQNIDLERGEVRLVTRKTGRTIIAPMSTPLRKHIENLPAGDSPAAPIHPRAFEVMATKGRVGQLSNQFADLLAQAGLRPKVTHQKAEGGLGRAGKRSGGGLSFHSIRHTVVSVMKDAGVPQAVVMEFGGHDSQQMSEHYTHVGRDALERAAATLPADL